MEITKWTIYENKKSGKAHVVGLMNGAGSITGAIVSLCEVDNIVTTTCGTYTLKDRWVHENDR